MADEDGSSSLRGLGVRLMTTDLIARRLIEILKNEMLEIRTRRIHKGVVTGYPSAYLLHTRYSVLSRAGDFEVRRHSTLAPFRPLTLSYRQHFSALSKGSYAVTELNDAGSYACGPGAVMFSIYGATPNSDF